MITFEYYSQSKDQKLNLYLCMISVQKVSSHCQYLKSQPCGIDVTCQPLQGDPTVYAWTIILLWDYSVKNEMYWGYRTVWLSSPQWLSCNLYICLQASCNQRKLLEWILLPHVSQDLLSKYFKHWSMESSDLLILAMQVPFLPQPVLEIFKVAGNFPVKHCAVLHQLNQSTCAALDNAWSNCH